MDLVEIHWPICLEVLRLMCRVGRTHSTPSLPRMGRSTEIVVSPTCCPSVSRKLKPVFRYWIPSHSHVGVYPQIPFVAVSIALIAGGSQSDVPPMCTMFLIATSPTPIYSDTLSLVFINSGSWIWSALQLPTRMPTGTGWFGYLFYTSFGRPVMHCITLYPSPFACW